MESLRGGELSAGQLVARLKLEQANASQHLAVLRARQVVLNRKGGNQVCYSLRHPAFVRVLDLLRDACYELLSESETLLDEMRRKEEMPSSRRRTRSSPAARPRG